MKRIDKIAIIVFGLLNIATNDSNYLVMSLLWMIWSELMEIKKTVKLKAR